LSSPRFLKFPLELFKFGKKQTENSSKVKSKDSKDSTITEKNSDEEEKFEKYKSLLKVSTK
jgi:hypothetical protein